MSERASGSPWARWSCRLLIAAFLIGLAAWGWTTGVALRDRVWSGSRTIRFDPDISNGLKWGGQVVRAAEADGTSRRPTFFQMVRGEGQVYAELAEGHPDGSFGLDYPPLRLMTMALWARSVQDRYPTLTEWPGDIERPRSKPHAGPGPTEDIAAPLLRMNTIAEAATALLAFALVWLWVDRGARSEGPTSLRRAHGLVVFPLAAAAFAWALSVAVLPIDAPPPAVALSGAPVVAPDGRSARLFGWVDPQGAGTAWHFEWGRVAGLYDHATTVARLGSDSAAVEVSAQVTDLPAGATAYYRLVATNTAGPRQSSRGTTRSADGVMVVMPGVVQPAAPREVDGAAWLTPWQWAGVAVLFLLANGAARFMPAGHRGWAAGTMAAIFVWFDPSLLIDAHVWPQWDAWLLPPFLAAALLASLDGWLAAGAMLGIGAMFKGQMLIGAPVILVWPLVSLRWGAAARLVVGFALASGLIVSPWLLSIGPASSPPLRWAVGVLVASGLAAALSVYRRPMRRLWLKVRDPADGGVEVSPLAVGLFAAAVPATVAAVTLLILHPWSADAGLSRGWGVVLVGSILVGPWVLRRRSLGAWSAAVLAATVWTGGSAFNGDWSWKTVGFEYGTRKWDHLAIANGQGANVGSVLSDAFGWDTHDPMLSFRPPDLAGLLYAGRSAAPAWLRAMSLDGSPVALDVRQTLMAVYAGVVLAAGIGAAIQARRRDPRFLAALIAPWLFMPVMLAQMMNRYYVWGAVLSSLLVGLSSSLGLLHVLLAVAAAGMAGAQLLTRDPARSPLLLRAVDGLVPHAAGLLLLAAAVVLCVALTPRRPTAVLAVD